MTGRLPTTFSGQSVVVTGAGSGIGRAAARRFAALGAHVLAVGRTAATLAETAAGYPSISVLAADISQAGEPQRVVTHAADRFSRLDVLVNNAGITCPALLGEIDPGLARQQIATNLLAPIELAQAALPQLREAEGVIVNVTSNPPLRGWPRNSVYGATKVALDFLTYTWAMELGPSGIRVVSVAPGPTETTIRSQAYAGLPADEAAELARRGLARIPLGRRATAEEIAWWITTAAGPDAAYLTGTVLRVDGGVSVA
jgi:C-7 ketoreductase